MLGLVAGLLSCSGSGTFVCESDEQCRTSGDDGLCQPTGYCSFPDGACASGQRYGSAAPGTIAGECVDPAGSTGAASRGGSTTMVQTGDDTTEAGPDATTLSVDSSTSDQGTTEFVSTRGTGGSTFGSETTGSTGAGERCATLSDPETIALFGLDSEDTLDDATGIHDGIWRDGTPELVAGPPGCGSATRFEGMLNGVVDDADAFHLEQGSFDMWVRLPEPPAELAVGLISRDALDQVNGGHISLWYERSGRLALRLQDAGVMMAPQIYVCSNGPLPQDEWIHVGVNFGAPGLELYLGGELQAGDGTVILSKEPQACEVSGGAWGIDGNANPWVIGAGSGGSDEGSADPVSRHFDGALDELRISTVRRDFAAFL